MRRPKWKALGYSQATWYRQGKPNRPYKRSSTQNDEAAKRGLSLRTFQRLMRVAETDPLLLKIVDGGTPIGRLEWYAADPERLRKLKRYLKQRHVRGTQITSRSIVMRS